MPAAVLGTVNIAAEKTRSLLLNLSSTCSTLQSHRTPNCSPSLAGTSCFPALVLRDPWTISACPTPCHSLRQMPLRPSIVSCCECDAMSPLLCPFAYVSFWHLIYFVHRIVMYMVITDARTTFFPHSFERCSRPSSRNRLKDRIPCEVLCMKESSWQMVCGLLLPCLESEDGSTHLKGWLWRLNDIMYGSTYYRMWWGVNPPWIGVIAMATEDSLPLGGRHTVPSSPERSFPQQRGADNRIDWKGCGLGNTLLGWKGTGLTLQYFPGKVRWLWCPRG